MFAINRSENADGFGRSLTTFLLAIVVLTSLAVIAGCGGPTCAPGTEERAGKCHLVADGCGDGTVLVDGVCTLEEAACGPDSRLTGGECTRSDEACQGATTFDQSTETCVPDASVVCGEDTKVGPDGTCEPVSSVCTSPSVMGPEGHCVIRPEVCGQNTQLDPQTNTCVAAAIDCLDGLVWDNDEDRCRGSEDVCGAGARFDRTTGLCIPDSCEAGDVLVDAVCLPQSAADLDQPDIIHEEEEEDGEFNDQNTIDLPSVGGEPRVIKGRLHATDEDGNTDEESTDRDIYEFDGQAFQWIDLTLLNYGHPGAYFEVKGPQGTVWRSPETHRTHMARQLVLPETGTYRITVGYDYGERDSRDGGDAEWLYGLIVQDQQPPAPQAVDLSSPRTLSGDLLGLRDNFYKVSGFEEYQALVARLDGRHPNASMWLQYWHSAELQTEQEFDVHESMYGVGARREMLVLVDWRELRQIPAPYEIEMLTGELLLNR